MECVTHFNNPKTAWFIFSTTERKKRQLRYLKRFRRKPEKHEWKHLWLRKTNWKSRKFFFSILDLEAWMKCNWIRFPIEISYRQFTQEWFPHFSLNELSSIMFGACFGFVPSLIKTFIKVHKRENLILHLRYKLFFTCFHSGKFQKQIYFYYFSKFSKHLFSSRGNFLIWR